MKEIDVNLEAAIRETVREEIRAVLREELRTMVPQALIEALTRAAGDAPATPAADAVRGGTPGDDGAPAVHHSDAQVRTDGRGRIVVDDAFLERIAAEYLEAERQGVHPNKALQDRYDRSRSAVSHWLKQAREKGLIPTPED